MNALGGFLVRLFGVFFQSVVGGIQEDVAQRRNEALNQRYGGMKAEKQGLEAALKRGVRAHAIEDEVGDFGDSDLADLLRHPSRRGGAARSD